MAFRQVPRGEPVLIASRTHKLVSGERQDLKNVIGMGGGVLMP